MTGTLNSTVPARNDGYQGVQFMYRNLTHSADNAVARTIGKIPAGSIILKALSGINVQTVTNAGTNNRIDVGTTADDDLYGTDLSTATAGFVPLDEAVGYRVSVDTTITATLDLTGTAATTGDLDVIIAYLPPND